MNDVLKYLGTELRRFYDTVVRRPMSWRMIDALESLDEASDKERERPQPREAEDPDARPARNGEDVGGARE